MKIAFLFFCCSFNSHFVCLFVFFTSQNCFYYINSIAALQLQNKAQRRWPSQRTLCFPSVFECANSVIKKLGTSSFSIASYYVSSILWNAFTLAALCSGWVCLSLYEDWCVLWWEWRGCWDNWLNDCKLLYYSPLRVIKTPIIVTTHQITHTLTTLRGTG